MFDHAESLAREEHVFALRLFVELNNHTAKAAYSQAGMTGDYYHLMEKRL